jgi:hypothetical protein
MYFTEDNAKEIKAEERAYTLWEREQKNLILNMGNVQKKQSLWNKLFTPTVLTDEYLTGNVF